MSKKVYTKIPLSYDDQLALLKKRGLVISDENKVLRYLKEISYYRLSAFFLSYQKVKDKFNPEVEFDQILDTYSFDRELRLLVFDCIERVEVAIRTQINYYMSHTYQDSHWQDRKRYFKKPFFVGKLKDIEINHFEEVQTIIRKAKAAKHPEVFIKHYCDKYKEPPNPPSWMCLELLTMGELSRLYNGLANTHDKQQIANFFDLPSSVFISWLHTLTYVRNICAHHSRFWNRELAIKPNVLKKPKGNWVNPLYENNKRTFYFLCILKYLLIRANPTNSFGNKLENLFKKYPNVPIQFLGIPSNKSGKLLDWKNELLWK